MRGSGLLAPYRRALGQTSRRAQFEFWRRSTSAGRENDRRLKSFRSRFGGRRAFVMGNGPSLLQCDLNKLAGEVTIVSNAHYLIWDRLIYVPTFLTVEDTLVAEDRGAEIRRLEGITKVLPFDLKSVLGEADPSTVYLYFERYYSGFPKFSFDLQRIAYWGGTVSFLNLQLAAYLGCNPIVMIGFDHSYQVPRERIEKSVITSREADVNHIHPDYFGPGYRWHDPNVERMETAYRCARHALEPAGVRVLNATAGGHLEVFDRVTYDSLFEGR